MRGQDVSVHNTGQCKQGKYRCFSDFAKIWEVRDAQEDEREPHRGSLEQRLRTPSRARGAPFGHPSQAYQPRAVNFERSSVAERA